MIRNETISVAFLYCRQLVWKTEFLTHWRDNQKLRGV